MAVVKEPKKSGVESTVEKVGSVDFKARITELADELIERNVNQGVGACILSRVF